MRYLICLLFLMQAPAGLAQSDPAQGVIDASVEIETATGLLIEARNATNRIPALSRAIRSLEDGLTALRVALRRSAAQESAIRINFAQKSAELGGLLSALQNIEQTAAISALLHPEGAVAAARAAMIIAAISPELEKQVAALQRDSESLDSFNTMLEATAANLRLVLADLQLARVDLNAAQELRQQIPSDMISDTGQLDNLLRAADDLAFLAVEIGKLSIGGPAQSAGSHADLRGELPAPVSGLLIGKFGTRDAAGQIRNGILISAAASSLVSAPQAGIVRFAGDFLNYGNMVILEPAEGYLQIFAGFGQVFVIEGDVMEAGDALGLLAGQVPAADEFLIEMSSATTGNSFQTLYIELRVEGEPVNPMLWFTGITE